MQGSQPWLPGYLLDRLGRSLGIGEGHGGGIGHTETF